jgi:hypothetical protein
MSVMAQKELFCNDDDDDDYGFCKKEPHFVSSTSFILFKFKSNKEFAFLFT